MGSSHLFTKIENWTEWAESTNSRNVDMNVVLLFCYFVSLASLLSLLHHVGTEHATSTRHYFVYDKNNIFRLSFIWVANGMMHNHSCMQPFTHSTELLSRVIHFRIGECVECTAEMHFIVFSSFCCCCCWWFFVGCFSDFSTPILRACCRPTNANLNNSMKPRTKYTQQTCELQRVHPFASSPAFHVCWIALPSPIISIHFNELLMSYFMLLCIDMKILCLYFSIKISVSVSGGGVCDTWNGGINGKIRRNS